VTSSVGGAILGTSVSLLFTKQQDVIEPVAGATSLAAGAFGYIMGNRTRITTGDAAVINSGVVWGSVAGGLFALSFDAGHRLGGGLVLSGLGMGTIGGLLLQQNFSITRTHAALIDVGGLIGIIGGLAAESLAYPTQTRTGPNDMVDARSQEHLANFALGGMALGLLGAGILTRDVDGPKIPVSPSITQATSASGRATTMYGVTGRW
jgi:hypothetical protein